jgi:cytosine/adenosine deaminase-related metal-dependent hydrolase
VTVALGTDSPGSGGDYDLRAEARAAALVHAGAPEGPPSAEELVRMATLGGAEALGMADLIGSLEPGKRADLAVLRPGPGGAGGEPHLAVLEPATAVEAVLVDGEPLLWRGEPVRDDGGRTDARAREVRARLC